jgi:hypothetical protein
VLQGVRWLRLRSELPHSMRSPRWYTTRPMRRFVSVWSDAGAEGRVLPPMP